MFKSAKIFLITPVLVAALLPAAFGSIIDDDLASVNLGLKTTPHSGRSDRWLFTATGGGSAYTTATGNVIPADSASGWGAGLTSDNGGQALFTKVTGYGGYGGITSMNYGVGSAQISVNDFGLAQQILAGTLNQTGLDALKQPGAFTNNGTYSISSSSILDGTETLVLQLRLQSIVPYNNTLGLTAFGIVQEVFPVTLSLNGGTISAGSVTGSLLQGIVPGRSDNGTPNSYTYHGELWTFEWDVSGLGPITDYEIGFSAFPFGIITGAQVDQVAAVPEPSHWLLLGLGVLVLGRVAHRQRRRQQEALS
ncbi:MAG TPA: PEP-CTERM sorting domain-containing protein [Chthoniobacteraceae bacterium]|nr:PEP-CTERM sorting domain-containing protein [Chthoniobacteraceae bacterium]